MNTPENVSHTKQEPDRLASSGAKRSLHLLEATLRVTTALCEKAKVGEVDDIVMLLSERQRLLTELAQMRATVREESHAHSVSGLPPWGRGTASVRMLFDATQSASKRLIELLEERKTGVFRQLQEAYKEKSLLFYSSYR